MSNKRIKGITVEIGGDTTGLSKALAEVDKNLRDTQTELRDVNRLLKLDPSNVTLLAQKQELLQKSIQDTEKRLETLKTASEQAAASAEKYDDWKKAYDPIQEEIDGTKKKISELKSAMQGMRDAGEVDTDGYRQLQEELKQSNKELKGLKDQAERTNAEFGNPVSPEAYRALQREVAETESKLKNLKNEAAKTADSVGNSAKDMADSFSEAGESMGEIGKKLDAGNLMQATEMLGGVADKLKEVGNAAKDSAVEFGDSQGKIQANLGLTAEEAENLNGVVKEVFGSGFTDSADEASEAVLLVKQNFKDLNDTDLSSISEQLLAISKRTGTDMQENIIGASKLMKTYGMDAQEALDLIAQGYQNNLNLNGDFMDTLNEYSPLFESAGYSASEMMNVLSTGMQNGARNSDLVADAIKELQIRLGDGSFEENLGKFSDGTKNVFEQWKNGQATVNDVANSISADLKKMSPADQQKALSALATQFEDLGADASIAILGISTDMEEATGKADQFAQATPGEEWQASLNQIRASLQETGAVILGILQPIIDKVADLAKWFGNLPGPVQEVVTAIGMAVTIVAALIPVITALAVAFAALATVASPIIAVILAIVAAVTAVILIIKNWDKILNVLKETFNTVIAVIQNILSGFAEFFSNLWNGIKTVFETVWNAIWQNPIIQIIVSTITALFEGMKTTLSGIWNGIKDIASGAWELIKNTILAPVLLIIDLVTGNFDKLKSDAQNIWENIKNAAQTIWNGIKQVIMAPIEGLITFVTSAFNSIKSIVVNIASSIWENIKKVPELIKKGLQEAIDFITSLPGKAVQWGKDFINGLKDGILSGLGKIKDAVEGVADKIRSFLHFSRPDEGPLRDYETWMPDMMEGLAKGIRNNIPLLQKAADAAAATINYEIMKDAPSKQIDPNQIYRAVKDGASDSSTSIYIGDRQFRRTLKGMGVVFE